MKQSNCFWQKGLYFFFTEITLEYKADILYICIISMYNFGVNSLRPSDTYIP